MNFISEDPPLFNKTEFYQWQQVKEELLKREVESYDANRFLNTPQQDLTRYFAEKFEVEPLVLQEDSITTEQVETTIRAEQIRAMNPISFHQGQSIPAIAFKFYIPFTGDTQLLHVKPNSFTSLLPRAIVSGNEIIFTFLSQESGAEAIRGAFKKRLNEINFYIQQLQRDVSLFNLFIRRAAETEISNRRDRLLKAQNTAAELGYPMRRRAGAPVTYAAPSVRRKIVPPQPPASNATYTPEPTLQMADYEHILGVLQNMALVLERSPSAFRNMGEEDLRQHFLVQLNGHYEGNATGETFNVSGKTDILVRENGKNIFIAECKFWRGPNGFQETIDQLLSYMSWRDTKTAIIIFNRETTFSTVLSKIPEGLRAHPNFKRQESIEGETRFRAILRHRDDASREMIITVLVFDVPR